MNIKQFVVKPGEKIDLQEYFTRLRGGFTERTATLEFARTMKKAASLQKALYAQRRYGVLVIAHGMDGSGKDGVISHMVRMLNPNWCRVASFKVPSAEELDHDFLWREWKELPRRGQIVFFNRSYYEEVSVVRVHPEFLAKQHLPSESKGPEMWDERYESINNMERHLALNGFPTLKVFLHISKDEQRRRMFARMEDWRKHWKFSLEDIRKRADWKMYLKAHQDMLRYTSSTYSKWNILPADYKWYARLATARLLLALLRSLDLEYPKATPEDQHDFLEAKLLLERERQKKR